MKFIYKLERRFGKYAIPNLMYYIIILYAAGFVISVINPFIYYEYLSLDASKILRGEVWRIVTFLIQPPEGGYLFVFLAMYLYYMIGLSLEKVWGAFRFNLYFFMGVLGHVLAAVLIYLTTGLILMLDTSYLNLSLFFGFAAVFPDMEFLLFFVIPVKAKWLALFNGIYFIYTVIFGNWASRCAAVLSIINFLIFFLLTRNYSRMNPKEMKRKAVFKAKVKNASVKTRHKCVVCGRTEKDGENLEFRYCTRCEGNYEYCQDHLYTHKHVTKE